MKMASTAVSHVVVVVVGRMNEVGARTSRVRRGAGEGENRCEARGGGGGGGSGSRGRPTGRPEET